MLEIIADMDGDDSKIEEQLEKLPGDVEPIYEKKLLQIQGSSDITLAKEVFQWLIISRRPLKIEGLARAYTVSEALKKKKRRDWYTTVLKSGIPDLANIYISSTPHKNMKDIESQHLNEWSNTCSQ